MLGAALLLAGCVHTLPVRSYAPRTPLTVSLPAKIIGLNRIVATIPTGQTVATIQAGLACVGHGEVRWSGLTGNEAALLADRFDREVGAAGYRFIRIIPTVQSTGTTESLFTPDRQLAEVAEAKANYLVAAVIRSATWNICYPWAGVGNLRSSKGRGSIDVEWKVYDRDTQTVVAEVVGGGSASMTSSSTDGRLLMFEAFSDAVRSFLSEPELSRLVGRQ